jgi:hypothetical protein
MDMQITILIISVLIYNQAMAVYQQDGDKTISILSEVSEKFESSHCSVIILRCQKSSADQNIYWLKDRQYHTFQLKYNPVASFHPQFSYNSRVYWRTGYRFVSRFSRACSFVIFENTSHVELSNLDVLWIRFHIPGGVFGSFHLFLDDTNNDTTIPGPTQTCALQMRYYATASPSSLSHWRKGKAFIRNSWNRSPIIYKINPGSGVADIDNFKATGRWNNYVTATTYYAAEYLNASQQFEQVYEAPVRGILASGGYGGYVQPLVDRTAHMASFNEPSSYPPGIILFSKTIMYDRASFLTAPSKLQMMSVVQALTLPFSIETWLVLLLVIIEMSVLLLAAEWILSFSESIDPFKLLQHTRRNLIYSFLDVLKAVLEQPGLEENVHPVLRKLNYWRCLVLWSLLSIVISAFYKSELIGAFVMPTFLNPPTNFDELSRSSFKINSIIFSGNMDVVAMVVNDSLAHQLISRARDVAWPNGMHKVCSIADL